MLLQRNAFYREHYATRKLLRYEAQEDQKIIDRQSHCQESASTCQQLASERPINDIIGRRRAHIPGTYDRHSRPGLWNN